MHPRSPYAEYTDFALLAKDCPSLAKYLVDGSNINFKDPDAVRELTKSLLKRDFGLEVALPEDRLCPAVPNRLNYVLWIQDLLDSTSGGATDSYDPERGVVGLDIGTGASCIYPLLACTLRPSWTMIGTDIDPYSLQCARANIARNQPTLTSRIAVFESTPSLPLIPPLSQLGIDRLDFTMCNPPFYASISAMFSAAQHKLLPPSSACTGTTTEMVHPGGEVAFTLRQLEASLLLLQMPRAGSTATWYTTMLGHLSSLETLVAEVRKHTRNYAVASFCQGATRRWGLAWSFGDLRPGVAALRYDSGKGQPFPTRFVFGVDGVEGGRVEEAVRGVLVELGGRVVGCVVVGEVGGNVWSRGARRAAKRGEVVVGEEGVKMGYRVEVGEGEGEGEREVRVRWTRGVDEVLFESFCGMLKRRVKDGLEKGVKEGGGE